MKKLLVSVLLVNLLAACASQKHMSEIEDKLFPAVEISGIEAGTILLLLQTGHDYDSWQPPNGLII